MSASTPCAPKTCACRLKPGTHAASKEFLAFSASVGNDLSTPRPEYGFGGLVPGDRWCLCAGRWQEALDAGVAPPVVLAATHALALEFSSLDDLCANAASGG